MSRALEEEVLRLEYLRNGLRWHLEHNPESLHEYLTLHAEVHALFNIAWDKLKKIDIEESEDGETT